MKTQSTKSLAQELVEVRANLDEVEEVYKGLKTPLEQKRQALSEQLLEQMRKDETFSTGFAEFRIVRKRTAKVVVTDELAAIGQLRQSNPEYISEAINPAALELVKKGTLQIEGVQREEREYISVTQNKPAEQAA